MAQVIQCDTPEHGPAAWLITYTEDGTTVGACWPCAADWSQALLAAFDASRLVAELRPDAPPPAEAEGPAAGMALGDPVEAQLGTVAEHLDASTTAAPGKRQGGAGRRAAGSGRRGGSTPGAG